MKGLVLAVVVRTKYGTRKIIIEVRDEKTYQKLHRKFRLLGIYLKEKEGRDE